MDATSGVRRRHGRDGGGAAADRRLRAVDGLAGQPGHHPGARPGRRARDGPCRRAVRRAGQAVALGRRVAPAGSRISVGRGGGTVVVRVSSPVTGPAGLFGHWAAFRVRAEAVAAQEPEAVRTRPGPRAGRGRRRHRAGGRHAGRAGDRHRRRPPAWSGWSPATGGPSPPPTSPPWPAPRRSRTAATRASGRASSRGATAPTLRALPGRRDWNVAVVVVARAVRLPGGRWSSTARGRAGPVRPG